MANVPSKSLLSVRGMEGRVSSKKKRTATLKIRKNREEHKILNQHRIYLYTQMIII